MNRKEFEENLRIIQDRYSHYPQWIRDNSIFQGGDRKHIVAEHSRRNAQTGTCRNESRTHR